MRALGGGGGLGGFTFHVIAVFVMTNLSTRRRRIMAFGRGARSFNAIGRRSKHVSARFGFAGVAGTPVSLGGIEASYNYASPG